MVRPVKVEPLSGYRLRVRYADGVEGIIDFLNQVGYGVLRHFVMKLYSATCKLAIAVRLPGQTISIFAPTQPIWKSREG